MGAIPASDRTMQKVSLAGPNNYQVLKLTRYRGLQRRVAFRLGCSEGTVWNVLHGRANNARIAAAIAAEVERCDAGDHSNLKKVWSPTAGPRLSKRYRGLQKRVALLIGASKEAVSRG
jgi:hypothetical protein